MSRVRSSVRCSIRLMPGSSARSVTALRARSMGSRSATLSGLDRGGLCGVCFGGGIVGDGLENGRERGVADWKASGGWHKVEIARGGDGQRLGSGVRLRLLVRVAYEELFGFRRDCGRRRDRVLGAVGNRGRLGSGGFHSCDFFSLLLLIG